MPKRSAEMLGADVAMISADGPAPLAGTAPVEDRDGASRTWTIATGLGASREAGDGPEEVQLAGHRWSWFAGGHRLTSATDGGGRFWKRRRKSPQFNQRTTYARNRLR